MERTAKVKDPLLIPHGQYCYEVVTHDFMGLGRLITNPCPYWRWIPGKPEHESGHCDYLEAGDGDGDIFLLWDQCKECGINVESPEEIAGI